MTTHLSIPPFAVDLEQLLPIGALACMSPAEIGVAYRVLRLAWSRNGSVPQDAVILIRSAGLLEADLVHVQSLITLAGQPEADGRSITFPILRGKLDAAVESAKKRSRAATAAINARWNKPEPPPDKPPGMRLVYEPNTTRIPSESGTSSALSESSSCARRSPQRSANQSAQTGARKSSTREERAPGAKASIPWALDLAKLSPEQADAERARRSAVHRQIHRARFPEAIADKEVLPSNVSEAIVYAPWVTEELAAFAVWEARETVKEFARRNPPEAFNPIGLVIAITGTQKSHAGKARQISLQFHQEWERRLEAQRQQANVHQAINAQFIADWKAKKAGGGA